MYWCPHRLAWSRTPAFQAGNGGSNPPGDAFILRQYQSVIVLKVTSITLLFSIFQFLYKPIEFALWKKRPLPQLDRLDASIFDKQIDRIDTHAATGRFFLNIMASLAQMERELIGERTRDALQMKKSRGELVGSVPYGYVLHADGKTLIEDPEGQKAVSLACDLRGQGYTFRRICTELEAWTPGQDGEVAPTNSEEYIERDGLNHNNFLKAVEETIREIYAFSCGNSHCACYWYYRLKTIITSCNNFRGHFYIAFSIMHRNEMIWFCQYNNICRTGSYRVFPLSFHLIPYVSNFTLHIRTMQCYASKALGKN